MKNIVFLLAVVSVILSACEERAHEENIKGRIYLERAFGLDKGGSGTDKSEACLWYVKALLEDNAHPDVYSEALLSLSIIADQMDKNHQAADTLIDIAIGISSERYLPLLYAYKGDAAMHYGAADSAIYYCKKALSHPQAAANPTVNYVANYALWNAYEQLQQPDSALCYKEQFDKSSYSKKTLYSDEFKNIEPDARFDNLKLRLKERINSLEKIEREKWWLQHRAGIIVGALLSLAILIIIIYRRRRKNSPLRQIVACDDSADNAPSANDDILLGKLNNGEAVFENSTMYERLNDIRIKERDFYRTIFSDAEQLENELFASFKEANHELLKNYALSSAELVCCYCTFMGFNNNTIAYVCHTTPATIRKRKERLRRKLAPEHYIAIFEQRE